jgi:hypothetical protein
MDRCPSLSTGGRLDVALAVHACFVASVPVDTLDGTRGDLCTAGTGRTALRKRGGGGRSYLNCQTPLRCAEAVPAVDGICVSVGPDDLRWLR